MPLSARGSAHRFAAADVAAAAAIIGLFLLFTYPWIYQGCFQDADPLQIAIGTHQGLASGKLFREPLLYRPSAHPLYYGLLFAGSALRGSGIDQIIALMNHLSWLATSVSLGLLYLICRTMASRAWCLLVVASVFSCPTIFALGTYGHPASVGLLLFLLGTLCLLRCVSGDLYPRSRFIALWLSSVILLAAAISTRAHVVFLFSAPLALCLALSVPPARALLSGTALLMAGAVYALTHSLLFGQAQTTPLHQLNSFVTTYYRPQSIHWGLLLGGYALGPGLALLLFGAVLWLLIRRQWTPLVLGAACILPTFLFWAGHPLPLRHFMHSIVGATFLLAVAGQQCPRPSRRLVVLGILTVTVFNLGLYPALGVLTEAAGYRRGGEVIARLTTSIFDSHRTRQQYWDWERDRWVGRAAALPDRTLFIGRYYELMGMMRAAVRLNEARGLDLMSTEGREGLWAMRMGDKLFYFSGWDGRIPDKLRRMHWDELRRMDWNEVRILAPYPPDQQKLMPAGVLDLPPERLWYHPIQ